MHIPRMVRILVILPLLVTILGSCSDMAGPKVITQHYQPQAGLDLRSSMMNRPVGSASSMKNLDYIHTNDGDALTQRAGYHYIATHRSSPLFQNAVLREAQGQSDEEVMMLLSYTVIDKDTGEETIKTLVAGDRLWEMVAEPVTITYAGSGVATAEVVVVSGVWNLIIVEDTVTLLSHAMPDLDDFLYLAQTAVNAIAGGDFDMIIGADDSGSQRVAFVDGNQTFATTLTVDDGSGGAHNFQVGDMIGIADPGAQGTYHKITEVTSTTMSFDTGIVGGPTPSDNDIIRFRTAYLPGKNLFPMTATVIPASGASALTLPIEREDSVNTSKVSVLGAWVNSNAARGNSKWRHLSYVTMNNVLYIAAPFEDAELPSATANQYKLAKYDGQYLYTPGMPQADDASVADSTTGSGLAAGDYQYIITWIQEDFQGNIVEGVASDPASVTMANNDATVTLAYTNIAAADGYLADNNFAVAASTQSTVNTISVDYASPATDHRLNVNDKVYLLDGSTGNYVTRTVVSATYPVIPPATGNGTITIDGDPVDVTNNDYITANSRVAIYRTKVGGFTDFFLVDEVPFGTTTYTDSTADASLGAQYLFPVANTEHTIPPSDTPFYITSHQGSLVFLGSLNKPNTVHYSVPGSPEYFPANLNFDVVSSSGQAISGGASNEQFLIVFKNDSTHIVSGQLLEPLSAVPAFRTDLLSGSIGCVSNATLVNAEGNLLFLSNKGPMIQTGGSKPEPLTDLISPVFTQNDLLSEDAKLRFIRATAVYNVITRKYILFLPAETEDGGVTPQFIDVNSNSRAFMYDITRGKWREWTNFNMADGGIYVGDGVVRFLSRTGSADSRMAQMEIAGSLSGLHDDTAAVDWEVTFGSESLDQPGVNKQWLRTSPYVPLADTPSYTLTWETFLDWQTTAHTTASVVFTGSELPGFFRHKPNKARALSHKLSHSTIYERVLLLGWDDEIAVPYAPALKEPK